MNNTVIDRTRLLDTLMNISAEEDVILEWCFSTLDDATIASCLSRANGVAAGRLRTDEASDLLTAVFANAIVRGVRWIQLQRRLATHLGLAEGGNNDA